MILIDDYDEAFKSAILNGFYDELASFINPFLESTLKLNRDCRFAIVIGTNRTPRDPYSEDSTTSMSSMSLKEDIATISDSQRMRSHRSWRM